MNSIEFPEMNYKHFREKKNAKFHIFLLLSIMGGISLITIYDRKFKHNRREKIQNDQTNDVSALSTIYSCVQKQRYYFTHTQTQTCY